MFTIKLLYFCHTQVNLGREDQTFPKHQIGDCGINCPNGGISIIKYAVEFTNFCKKMENENDQN